MMVAASVLLAAELAGFLSRTCAASRDAGAPALSRAAPLRVPNPKFLFTTSLLCGRALRAEASQDAGVRTRETSA